MKKLLALVLCLVMVLSLTAVAFADEGVAEGGTDAEESAIDTGTAVGDQGTDPTIEGAIEFIYGWYDAVVDYMWDYYSGLAEEGPLFDGMSFDEFYEESYAAVAVEIVIGILEQFVDWYNSVSQSVA